MPLSSEQVQAIENVIRDSIRRKLSHYRPETKQMPFHYRLLGRDRMALFSFIHSLNTTFGTSIAIPYNPYEPRPYERWTLKGMLDVDHELKVGKDFWDFLGGEGAYEDLLECFQAAGISLRSELDTYFSRFNH
jgi:hypothetical protein